MARLHCTVRALTNFPRKTVHYSAVLDRRAAEIAAADRSAINPNIGEIYRARTVLGTTRTARDG